MSVYYIYFIQFIITVTKFEKVMIKNKSKYTGLERYWGV